MVGKDDITLDFAGVCGHGSAQCPAVRISGPQGEKTVKESPIKFTADPVQPSKPVTSFGDFLRDWVVPDLPSLDYQVYTLTNLGCAEVETQVAEVHCFPTMKWGGEVSLGYGTVSGDKKRNEQNLGEKSEWKFEAKLDGNIGNESWQLKTGKSRDATQYMPGTMDMLRDFVDRMDEIAEAISPQRDTKKDGSLVNFKLGWPNVSFGGNIELQEMNRDTHVGIGGELFLSMAPLISAEVKTDVLDWLILAAGPAHGKLLQEIKKKAAEGVKSKHVDAKMVVAVDIVLKGEVAGAFKWQKNAADTWLSTEGDKSGEATLGLTIGLEAKISVDTRVFFVKIKLGAEFHAKGARNEKEGIGFIMSLVATTEAGQPALGGNILFTGCALYYTYYAEVGVEGIESDDKRGKRRQRQGELAGARANANNPLSTDVSAKEQELKKLVTLFEARKLFDDESNSEKNVPVKHVKF